MTRAMVSAVVFLAMVLFFAPAPVSAASPPATYNYTGTLDFSSHPYNDYTVTLQAGDQVVVLMECTGTKTLDPYIVTITNPGGAPANANDGGSSGCAQGSRPGYSDPGPTNGARIEFTTTSAGLFRFRARSYDNITGWKGTGTGDYSFTITVNGGTPVDSDGDGVADNADLCPNTPANTPVNASGCIPDTDGDGVTDNVDLCPATPAGTPVNATGCPLDSDGDGVNDGADLCPGTPADTPVDATGCPVVVPPTDSDGDGVNDGADLCADTPADTPVDATGCPVVVPPTDSDGDGVNDGADLCADTPANTPVDALGCPVVVPPTDSDGDGVADESDICPETAPNTPVNEEGCPAIVDLGDTDGDGIADESDECPNTPAGAAVDEIGCPLPPPVTPVTPVLRPGCDTNISMPAQAVVGTFVENTPLYWMPDEDHQSDVILEAGKTAWVFYHQGSFYQILWQCSMYWVPADSIGPNYDSTWNGAALPD
jgi:hypothetical protein